VIDTILYSTTFRETFGDKRGNLAPPADFAVNVSFYNMYAELYIGHRPIATICPEDGGWDQ
jgi:hypothetical protein